MSEPQLDDLLADVQALRQEVEALDESVRRTAWLISEWRGDLDKLFLRVAALDTPTGDYRQARGILGWKEGDELPEERIRRMRDGD